MVALAAKVETVTLLVVDETEDVVGTRLDEVDKALEVVGTGLDDEDNSLEVVEIKLDDDDKTLDVVGTRLEVVLGTDVDETEGLRLLEGCRVEDTLVKLVAASVVDEIEEVALIEEVLEPEAAVDDVRRECELEVSDERGEEGDSAIDVVLPTVLLSLASVLLSLAAGLLVLLAAVLLSLEDKEADFEPNDENNSE